MLSRAPPRTRLKARRHTLHNNQVAAALPLPAHAATAQLGSRPGSKKWLRGLHMQAAGPSLCSGTEPCLLVRLTLLLMRKRGKRTRRRGKLSPLSGAPQARTRQCMLRLELRRRVRVLWSLDCITATGTSCHIHLPGTYKPMSMEPWRLRGFIKTALPCWRYEGGGEQRSPRVQSSPQPHMPAHADEVQYLIIAPWPACACHGLWRMSF